MIHLDETELKSHKNYILPHKTCTENKTELLFNNTCFNCRTACAVAFSGLPALKNKDYLAALSSPPNPPKNHIFPLAFTLLDASMKCI